MNIIVTGGAGFIGLNLCLNLLDSGHSVTVYDNFYSSNRANLKNLMTYENFSYYEKDIREANFYEEQIHNNIDIIFHLACPASPQYYQKSFIYTHETCTIGTMNVLKLAYITGATLVLASTSEIYGDPTVDIQYEFYRGNVNTTGPRSCYDEGKRVSETICYDYSRELGVKTRIARIFNTYGPLMDPQDGRIVSNFITQALRNEPITIYGNGSQTRSLCYISDTVDFLIKLGLSGDENNARPINIGNPDEYTVTEIADKIIELTNSKSEKVNMDLPIDDPRKRKPGIFLAKELLNWEPQVRIDEGLKNTIRYYAALINT